MDRGAAVGGDHLTVRYLLDTAVILDHVHGHKPASWLLGRLLDDQAELLTCDVVIGEALVNGTDEQRDAVSLVLGTLEYVPTSALAAVAAATARTARRREGFSLGLADALISAVAMSAEATLVTRGRPALASSVPGLQILSY